MSKVLKPKIYDNKNPKWFEYLARETISLESLIAVILLGVVSAATFGTRFYKGSVIALLLATIFFITCLFYELKQWRSFK